MSGPVLNEIYPAVSASVPLARRAVAAFATAAGAEPGRLAAISLAASEAVTNVVLHAYREHGGTVHVTAKATASDVRIVVADTGGGMEPRSDSPGMGLGLALMADASDELSINHRAGGGVEVHLRFALSGDGRR